jgi:hypothetical protein
VSATLQLKIPMTSTASWLLLKKNRRGCGSCLARSDTGASRAARSAEAESRGAGYVAGAVAGTEARTPGVDVAYKNATARAQMTRPRVGSHTMGTIFGVGLSIGLFGLTDIFISADPQRINPNPNDKSSERAHSRQHWIMCNYFTITRSVRCVSSLQGISPLNY